MLADLDLSYDLAGLTRQLLSMIPRRATRLELLIDDSLDMTDMRQEFHGGGSLDDPVAPQALRAAVDTLHASLKPLHESQVLIVRL